jgi:hypothetical protein
LRKNGSGLFWDDTPEAKRISVIPDPVWLSPDYLPNFEEARKYKFDLFSDVELIEAQKNKDKLTFDIEIYWNYLLIGFKSETSGKIVYFERQQGYLDFNLDKLKWVVYNFTLISFNGNGFDLPLLALLFSGKSVKELKTAANEIISEQKQPYEVLRNAKIKKLIGVDHIDMIEVCPNTASLKKYASRIACQTMQDLPFHPDALLTPDQIVILRKYWLNDLDNTELLYRHLIDQINLRIELGKEYDLDLRSHSDAQLAQAVIANELKKLTNHWPSKPDIKPGSVYKYKAPKFLEFKTDLMRNALLLIESASFVIGDSGYMTMPPELDGLNLRIGDGVYRMGIGGLHSSEESISHYADEHTLLVDNDMTSFYPYLILIMGLFPKHIGVIFLKVYELIVNKRVAAKKDGFKIIADCLKIVINGTYGKLGDKFSFLYSPDLLIQVTMTGQLLLLMLIETQELAGFSVISANTDGVVTKCPIHRKKELDSLIALWEIKTGFNTEETQYKAIYSRDVNNYVAIKTDGKIKGKGAFANPWGDAKEKVEQLKKNPQTPICVEAVYAKLLHNSPIEKTIRNEKDFRKFISVREVKGGGVKNGEYLGKVVRWYYADNETGEIVYAKTGNKVAKSDNAKPIMQFPKNSPIDINYNWYINEAESMLCDIGYKNRQTVIV